MNQEQLLCRDNDICDFFGAPPLMAASIRVTKRCNLQCVHCYANSKISPIIEAEMSTEEILDVINQLGELKVNEIFFTGGEPLIRKDMADILNYASAKGIRVLMSTNGLLLTESFLEKVRQVDFKLFQISLDGPEAIHETIRGKGNYQGAIRAVEMASRYVPNVAVGTVLSRMNVDFIAETLEIAHKAGASIFALMLLIPSGRATKDMNADALIIKDSLERFFNTYRQLKNKIRLAYNSTIPPALYPTDMMDTGLHMKCALCSFPYTIGIEANGDLAPCDGFFGLRDFEAGNIRQSSIKEFWEKHHVFEKIRDVESEQLKGVCNLCSFKNFCGGGCRAAAVIWSGDIYYPDPVCQELFDAGIFPESALK